VTREHVGGSRAIQVARDWNWCHVGASGEAAGRLGEEKVGVTAGIVTVPVTEESDLRVQQVPWEGRDVTIPAVTPTFSSTSRPAASP